jgi:hypothetical protein
MGTVRDERLKVSYSLNEQITDILDDWLMFLAFR